MSEKKSKRSKVKALKIKEPELEIIFEESNEGTEPEQSENEGTENEDTEDLDETKDENKSEDSTVVLSIDIGMSNLALYKEKIDLSKVDKVKRLALAKRYLPTGECQPQMKEELDKLYLCGASMWIDKADITREDDTKVGAKKKRRIVTNRMLLRLTAYLDGLKEKGIFDDVDTIIIEKQLKVNPGAQEIQFHIRSYFLFHYREDKDLYSFNSKYKTQILGCYKKYMHKKKEKLVNITKTQRKNWAKEKALYILALRDDMKTLNYVFNDNKNKADDLSDCLCQLQAFVYLKYVSKSFSE